MHLALITHVKEKGQPVEDIHLRGLIEPWVSELRTACEKAKTDLDDRELVVEMNNLSAISQEGENVLLDLPSEGIKFRCHGVFTKLILKQLARRAGANVQGQSRNNK
jgi:hypothetical protein